MSRHAQQADKPLPPPLTLGYAPSHDPGEFVVAAAGNRFEAPAGAQKEGVLLIHAALFNSQRVVNRKLGLSPEPTGDADAQVASGQLKPTPRTAMKGEQGKTI